MRIALGSIVVALVACGTPPQIEVDALVHPTDAQTYHFGPYTVQPREEVSDKCIQISLHNETELFINQVELTTGPGFHHSNWFFVRENTFIGDDGTWTCDDRAYSEPAAALSGGVLFAQSTQAPHEIQKFPDNVALKIPPYSKLVAQIHLLNSGDAPLDLNPFITITPIRPDANTILMAGVSFQNQALRLPAMKQSRFTIECDLAERHNFVLGRDPDFKIYYGLAHYHELGIKLDVEAIKPDGTLATIFTTTDKAGDVMGGPIDPLFDMTGYSKLRFSCEFVNDRNVDVRWGIGDQEMCVFLAFSDSDYQWGGGHSIREDPTPAGMDGNTVLFNDTCDVYAIDARR